MKKTRPPEAASVSDAVSRRDFLADSGRLVTAACLAGVTAGAVRLSLPDVESGRRPRARLGAPADFKMGTVTWLQEHELFVCHKAHGFAAFSSRCPHLGCTVRRTTTGFRCPCHGARFDPEGRVVSGPARRALDWFAVETGPDGQLWVDRSRATEPGSFTPLRVAAAESAG
ncbi:MAG: Rieske (2Fe-2S) protein [Deltaproteobacteria bacterium]|nr:Rieske (2Fe-2S) protein [Deltaproteobacteria bacterium]